MPEKSPASPTARVALRSTLGSAGLAAGLAAVLATELAGMLLHDHFFAAARRPH